MVSDSEALLGPYKDVLRGETYEEKIGYFFDCLLHADKEGYGVGLSGEEIQDIRVIMSTAGDHIPKQGLLREKYDVVKGQIENLLKRKNRVSIEQLVRSREEL